jgi:hypothetical protein
MFCSLATLLVDRSLPLGKLGGNRLALQPRRGWAMAPAPGVAEAMAAKWLGAAYGPQATGRSAGLPVHRSCVSASR